MSDSTESEETERCRGGETDSCESVRGEGRPLTRLNNVDGFLSTTHGEEGEEDGEVSDWEEKREGGSASGPGRVVGEKEGRRQTSVREDIWSVADEDASLVS